METDFLADAARPVLIGNQDGLLDQPAPGALTVRYRPDDEEAYENPPRFIWMPTLDESSEYVIQVSADEERGDSAAMVYPGIRRNFFTPHHAFAPGRYRWRYAVWDPRKEVVAGNWSSSRSFAVPEGLTATPLPSASDRLARADLRHPRLWLGPDRRQLSRRLFGVIRTIAGSNPSMSDPSRRGSIAI